MKKIYTIEFLKYLKDSPLVARPSGLPPTEQWMGLTADSIRNKNKSTATKTKSNYSDVFLDPIARRPVTDKHLPRNNSNTEDIVLGPPKTSFISATSIRSTGKNVNSPDRSGNRETGFGLRTKTRPHENDRTRESRNNLIRSRRPEVDQDNEGWNTIRSRKSFGGEDSERLSNGPGGDKIRDEKTSRDRDDYDGKERSWGLNSFSREKDIEHDQFPERNHRSGGVSRGRNEQSWLKEKDNYDVPFSSRDRYSNSEKHIDRSRGWRGKEKDDRIDIRSERFTEKNGDREIQGDRRWDKSRDQRNEHEPEWMEDPVEDKRQAHTLADFEKWKEQMQGKDRVIKKMSLPGDTSFDPESSLSSREKPKIETPLEFDPGPDKFLSLFNIKDEGFSDSLIESMSEGASKSKTTGKASRFTSFFTAQDEPHKAAESQSAIQSQSPTAHKTPPIPNEQSDAEKEAFQQLLQKLQRQTLQAPSSVSPANVSLQPKPSISENTSCADATQDLYQNYSSERQGEGRPNTQPQQAFRDLFLQRQMNASQNAIRPEQMLQELVSQRQNSLCQPSTRVDQQPKRNNNTEFLMCLMQGSKSTSESQRSEQLVGIPSKSDNRQMSQHAIMEREQEIQRETAIQRERSAPERHTRHQPPPGFFEETNFSRGPALSHDRQTGNSQASQIIQRPPPPGLDIAWERQAQLPPPQHRHVQKIAPPPGLTNTHNRAMPIPQQAFPPGFSMGNFAPPDVMSVSPRNIQMQPPPGFFNAPPHGFLPPGMGGFQGPESMAFAGSPFDGRGPPPQGSFRRQ